MAGRFHLGCAALALAGAAAAQTLTVEPAQLSFAVAIGSPSPAPQPVQVGSLPPGQPFSAMVLVSIISTDWVSVESMGPTPGSLRVTVDASRFLSPGTRMATIVVSLIPAGPTRTVTVTATASGEARPPAIAFAPATLSFSSFQGGPNPGTQTFSVHNSGGGLLTYQIEIAYPAGAATSWLAVEPLSRTAGSTPGSHTVSVTTGSLAAGGYTATIRIVAAGAANTPQTLAVSFTVGPLPAIAIQPP